MFSHKEMVERYLSEDPHALPRKGVAIRMLSFIFHLIKNIRILQWLKMLRFPEQAVIFFARTGNEFACLAPVMQKTPHAVSIGHQAEYSSALLDFLAHLISLVFLPKTLLFYHRSSGWRREAIQYTFDQFWLTYGQYLCFRLWLRLKQPALLVQSNDHSTENRVLLKAASDEKIQTAYLQHGAVFDQFPPLQFDFALLDGRDALHVYDSIGQSQTKVFLVGKPRFDQYADQINRRSGISVIGISTNSFDPIDRTRELAKHLAEQFPAIPLFLRPHPTDKRLPGWKTIADHLHIGFSDPTREDVYRFLQKVDVLFAGNSSIHLDAALLNVMPFFYDFTLKPHLQANSFIRNGLCQYVDSPEKAAALIQTYIEHRPDVRKRSKAYCETIETSFEKHSAALAGRLLSQLSGCQTDLRVEWKRVEGTGLEAYSPAALEPLHVSSEMDQ